jgi:hypothetical protein
MIFSQLNTSAGIAAAIGVGKKLESTPPVPNGVVSRHLSDVLAAKNSCQVKVRIHRAIGGFDLCRWHTETPIEAR